MKEREGSEQTREQVRERQSDGKGIEKWERKEREMRRRMRKGKGFYC